MKWKLQHVMSVQAWRLGREKELTQWSCLFRQKCLFDCVVFKLFAAEGSSVLLSALVPLVFYMQGTQQPFLTCNHFVFVMINLFTKRCSRLAMGWTSATLSSVVLNTYKRYFAICCTDYIQASLCSLLFLFAGKDNTAQNLFYNADNKLVRECTAFVYSYWQNTHHAC